MKCFRNHFAVVNSKTLRDDKDPQRLTRMPPRATNTLKRGEFTAEIPSHGEGLPQVVYGSFEERRKMSYKDAGRDDPDLTVRRLFVFA